MTKPLEVHDVPNFNSTTRQHSGLHLQAEYHLYLHRPSTEHGQHVFSTTTENYTFILAQVAAPCGEAERTKKPTSRQWLKRKNEEEKSIS
jgi:hypothetical protein